MTCAFAPMSTEKSLTLMLGEEFVDASSAPSTKIDVFVPSRTPVKTPGTSFSLPTYQPSSSQYSKVKYFAIFLPLYILNHSVFCYFLQVSPNLKTQLLDFISRLHYKILNLKFIKHLLSLRLRKLHKDPVLKSICCLA